MVAARRYCDAVKAHQSDLGGLVSSGGGTALIRALPTFEDLAAKAPSDVDGRLEAAGHAR